MSSEAPTSLDGFDVLDVCHRQTLFALGKLAALVARLKGHGPDPEARAIAAEIVHFFSTTAREHHEDEERHVFPSLLSGADPEIVQAVLRLQQDHHWLHIDWMELSPQLEAVAAGQTGYDIDALREGAQVFIALELKWSKADEFAAEGHASLMLALTCSTHRMRGVVAPATAS
jgi:iron-sulfur cluster repair protein YtfE (RIC family)